ncbi:MAG: SHOCT domain-containing protein [Rhodospirillales bacterium]|nr:SHOCT domain-containing protein [Rhodospirillales bacterium]
MVAVGSFQDRRKFDSNYLGAIRGGYGNPLKKLMTPVPVSAVVQQSFADGLKARGLLSQSLEAPYTLTGVVEQYDCNQFARREAHAKILVTVTETSSGTTLMEELFERDKVTGSMVTFDAGVFASTEDLRLVAADVLREVVDDALGSVTFRQIVTRSPPASVPDPGTDPGIDPSNDYGTDPGITPSDVQAAR